jgi:hypothetical protein
LQIKVFNRWLILLYATPLSALSVFIFLTCTQKRMDMIFISVFYLLAAICIFVTFRKTANIGFVFIVAAAFELLTISIALIINHQLAARKRAREQAAKS